MKFSTSYFQMKRKILADFQIYISLSQGFGKEKDENDADLCLHSIALFFESGFLWCSILGIKIAIRF